MPCSLPGTRESPFPRKRVPILAGSALPRAAPRGAPQPLLEGKAGGLRAGQVPAGPSRADCHPRLTCACSLLLLWAPQSWSEGPYIQVWPPQPHPNPTFTSISVLQICPWKCKIVRQHLCIKAETIACIVLALVPTLLLMQQGLAKSNCISCQDVRVSLAVSERSARYQQPV